VIIISHAEAQRRRGINSRKAQIKSDLKNLPRRTQSNTEFLLNFCFFLRETLCNSVVFTKALSSSAPRTVGSMRLRVMNSEEMYSAAQGMHLQWFAAEDEGRIFDPTETTYRKAREEGRVSKSQELISALGLLLPALAIIFLASWIFRTCVEMLRFFFTRINEMDPITDRFTAGIFTRYYLQLALPVLIVAFVTAIFSNMVQVGFLFTTKPLEPDFSKILPKFAQYFQRTLFSVEGLVNLIKSIAKMGVIGVVAFSIIKSKFELLKNLQTAGLWAGITLIASLAAQLLVVTALLLLFISIPDIFFQRWQFKESLKMTREARKEELKQDEGDQDMRHRLRNRYRELLSRNMLSAVPNADVVITNPTHYSVALGFDIGKREAPRVVAKGEDELAFRIREVAKVNDVPVQSDPPLARALYAETEVGDEIPFMYWKAVSIILKKFYIYDQQMQKKARRASGETSRMGA